jgi:hypothetical protein
MLAGGRNFRSPGAEIGWIEILQCGGPDHRVLFHQAATWRIAFGCQLAADERYAVSGRHLRRSGIGFDIKRTLDNRRGRSDKLELAGK